MNNTTPKHTDSIHLAISRQDKFFIQGFGFMGGFDAGFGRKDYFASVVDSDGLGAAAEVHIAGHEVLVYLLGEGGHCYSLLEALYRLFLFSPLFPVTSETG